MMKRSSVLKWTISCSLLLLSTLVWSQTFNKIYPASDARKSKSHSIDLDANSDSLITHGITITGAKSLLRRTIAPDGETSTLRTKEFGDTSLFAGIAESYRMEGGASMYAYGSSQEAIFERLDDNFETVYRINRSHTDTSYCLNMLSVPSVDGGTILGRTCILQYDTIIGDDAVPVILEKRDSEGNLIWETTFYGDHFGFYWSSLIEMPNGDILVTGVDLLTWEADPTILHFTSEGAFIDQDIFVPFPNNNLWDQGCHCTLFTDTTVVCAYTQALYHALDDPYNLPDWTIRELHLMEYNPSANEVIWDQAYENNIGHMNQVNDIERTNDGEIIIVGSLYHSPLYYELCDSIFSFTFSYLSRFDATGNLEWHREYTHDMDALSYPGSEHILYDVEEMPDGGFVAIGDRGEYNLTNTTSPWVIRTDEWGCVEPECQNIAVSEFALDNFATVFPNPSTGALNIHTAHAAHLQLFNSNGQLLHEQALLHSGQYQIALNHPLPAGVYVVHLSNERSAQRLKWVVVE